MPFHGATVYAASAVTGAIASSAADGAGGSGWAQLAAGSLTAISVALIGLYATIQRRRNGEAEDMNAISIARTTDQNLSTFRGETNVRLEAIEKWQEEVDKHLRPWATGE